MSRGQIDTYELTGLSPEATGVPSQSRAAQIVANSLQTFGKVLADREDKKSEVEAVNKLGDFDVEYTQMKESLQKAYWENPEAYPEVLREESAKLQEKYASSLKGMTADKFKLSSERYLTQDASASVVWAAGREKQKIVGDVKTGYHNVALKAETDLSPESLENRLNGSADDPLTLPAQNKRARAFLSEEEVLQLSTQTRKQIVQNGMDARIVADAAKTYREVAQGLYDKILSPDEKKAVLDTARTAMQNMALLQQYRSLTTAAVEVSNLVELFNEGALTVSDINRNLQWAELNQNKVDPVTGEKVISDNYIRGLQRLRDIALTQDFRTKETKAVDELQVSQDFENKWNNFLLGKGPNAKATAKDYDDIIGLYADLLDAYSSRKIDQATFERKKRIIDTVQTNRLGSKAKAATLTEALQKAGKYSWLDSPNDVYSAGYKAIQKYLDKKRPDLSEADKLAFRDQLLLEYTRRAKELSPEAQKNKQQSAEALLFGSGNMPGIIKQMSIYQLPNGTNVRFGDQVDFGKGIRGIFLGIDEKTGLVKLAPSKDFIKEVNNG